MTEKLKGLKPEKVFYYFEQLCRIPHGSGNTDAISEYCVEFAKAHDLKYIKDSNNNVVIYKPAFAGYEDHKTVIIQGHLDMVCEKTADSHHDFTKDPLRLYVEDDFVKAENTTLGGDDGIAVAYALAILDDDTIEHPPIEAVFTVDEEIGMLGAAAMDMSVLSGKFLLNIDSEEEGVFLTGCAGGLRADIKLPVKNTDIPDSFTGFEISITGLLGGHSGTEIVKGRANAHKILGRLLFALNKSVRYSITDICGGTKDNAIACNVVVKGAVEQEDLEELKSVAAGINEELKIEYYNCDDNIAIKVSEISNPKKAMIDLKTKEILTFFLVQAPNGVVKMSSNIEGLVETSLNCGIMNMDDKNINIGFSVRSSIESAKWALYEQLEYLSEFLGGTCEPCGDYPGWRYRVDSKLRDVMCDVYRQMYGSEPEITTIHAGLECGIFADNLEDIDIISYGPDIFDIHTVNERLSVKSVERVWKMTLEVLKRL